MIYVISDNHWGHTNIIRFCNRPFSSTEEMNKFMLESWNKVIKPDDEVYYLGDFSLKFTRKGIHYLMQNLNGKKYMIKGNHDRSADLNNLLNSSLIEWWKYDHQISYDYNGKTYNFSLSHYPHYPIKGSDIICLYGHIHGRDISDNQGLDVGVDNIGYEPLSIIQIIELMERRKNSVVCKIIYS
jgi:calcineurin-like phosphoesterase family protein